MFKVGDKVRRVKYEHFGMKAGDVGTVSSMGMCGRVELEEFEGHHSVRCLEIAQSPIRTGTRREIVPGTYGRIKVTGTYEGNRVTMEWDRSDVITAAVPIVGLSAEELREASHIFNQLAEALEDKP